MAKKPECRIESDGHDIFVVFNGVRIAKRGHPGHSTSWHLDCARTRVQRHKQQRSQHH